MRNPSQLPYRAKRHLGVTTVTLICLLNVTLSKIAVGERVSTPPSEGTHDSQETPLTTSHESQVPGWRSAALIEKLRENAVPTSEWLTYIDQSGKHVLRKNLDSEEAPLFVITQKGLKPGTPILKPDNHAVVYDCQEGAGGTITLADGRNVRLGALKEYSRAEENLDDLKTLSAPDEVLLWHHGLTSSPMALRTLAASMCRWAFTENMSGKSLRIVLPRSPQHGILSTRDVTRQDLELLLQVHRDHLPQELVKEAEELLNFKDGASSEEERELGPVFAKRLTRMLNREGIYVYDPVGEGELLAAPEPHAWRNAALSTRLALERTLPRETKLHLGGHSMGGLLSVLSDLKAQFEPSYRTPASFTLIDPAPVRLAFPHGVIDSMNRAANRIGVEENKIANGLGGTVVYQPQVEKVRRNGLWYQAESSSIHPEAGVALFDLQRELDFMARAAGDILEHGEANFSTSVLKAPMHLLATHGSRNTLPLMPVETYLRDLLPKGEFLYSLLGDEIPGAELIDDEEFRKNNLSKWRLLQADIAAKAPSHAQILNPYATRDGVVPGTLEQMKRRFQLEQIPAMLSAIGAADLQTLSALAAADTRFYEGISEHIFDRQHSQRHLKNPATEQILSPTLLSKVANYFNFKQEGQGR